MRVVCSPGLIAVPVCATTAALIRARRGDQPIAPLLDEARGYAEPADAAASSGWSFSPDLERLIPAANHVAGFLAVAEA